MNIHNIELDKTDGNFNLPAFKGKFVKNGKFTKLEEDYIDSFIRINKEVLKRKSYDVEISKDTKNDRIVMSSFFKSLYSDKPYTCLISLLSNITDLSVKSLERDTSSFKINLNWFENYKKNLNGYNSLYEKLAYKFFDLFN